LPFPGFWKLEIEDWTAGSADTVEIAYSAELMAMLAVTNVGLPFRPPDLLNPADYCKAETLV
jgi:hypothetical protein